MSFRTTISFNFELNSLKGIHYLNLYNHFVKFLPDKFFLKKRGKTWRVKDWSEKSLKEIEKADSEDLLMASSNDKIFLVGKSNCMNSYTIVDITQENFLVNDSDIKDMGFISAYLYDRVYVTVQNTVYDSNIEGRGFPLNSIKDTPFIIDPNTGIKEYDISFNPGRLVLIGHTSIVAAWKMWFGEKFFDLISKEHLLSFPYAYKIKELENGQVFVQLFEKIEESDSIENMEIQRKWLSWIEIDKLKELYV